MSILTEEKDIKQVIDATETWVVARALNVLVEKERDVGTIRSLATASTPERFSEVLFNALARLRTLAHEGKVVGSYLPSDDAVKKVMDHVVTFGKRYQYILATRALAVHPSKEG